MATGSNMQHHSLLLACNDFFLCFVRVLLPCSSDEWKTNPFMRCREANLLAYTGESDAVKCLGVIRARKSAWRP